MKNYYGRPSTLLFAMLMKKRRLFRWLLRSKLQASAEYWIHFTARFGGVYAFDYNSAESEPIRLKYGALWVHCRGLATADFGHDPRSNDIWRARRNFIFCRVSNARFHRFSVGQILRNWNTTRRSARRLKLLEQNLENFTIRCRFSKKWKHFSKIL